MTGIKKDYALRVKVSGTQSLGDCPLEHAAYLTLADGSRIGIVAATETPKAFAARLRNELQLTPGIEDCDQVVTMTRRISSQEMGKRGAAGKLETVVGYIVPPIDMPFVWPFRDTLGSNDATVLVIQKRANFSNPSVNLEHVSVLMAIGLCAQERGGVLLHGALVEQHGNGFILAGPGGIGKTTASQRLTYPWQALSDDSALVVRDGQGGFWAHPWPTWSQFVLDGPRGSWNMPRSVRLRGIFVLARAERDQAESVGPGRAVTLMNESSKQAWAGMSPYFESDQRRMFESRRFQNLCALAEAVPTHILHFTRLGEFWKTIEHTWKVLPTKLPE